MTTPVPKRGGEYAEGIIGQPSYINPLLSQMSEADADLSQLIYSGLFKYDAEGNIANDIAEGYEVSEDRLTYTVYLRKDVLWHDGQSLIADDVAFTVAILQDPAYRSPLRLSWQGVQVRKEDDYKIIFTLSTPFAGFINNLTIGILPKHVWENVPAEKFSLTEFNLHPIGSGPFSFVDLSKDSAGNVLSYELQSFPGYYGGEPFVPKITFNFYPDGDSAVAALNKKEVKGLGNVPLENLEKIQSQKAIQLHELNIPRYFAVFFNQTKSFPLADDEVRKALALAIDRDAMIQTVLQGKGTPVSSSFLPHMSAFNGDAERYNFNIDEAKKKLDDAGWKVSETDGVRKKDDHELSFTMYTTDWPELSRAADVLQMQWEQIGVRVKVERLAVSDIQQNRIRPREYEALLFGQMTTLDPDLYSFWHSSQKQDPGFNFALLDDKKVDGLLDEIRQNGKADERIAKLKELQSVLAEKNLAIFLFSPHYVYPVDIEMQGFDMQNLNAPSWRFAKVNTWYLKTKRIWK